LVALLLLWRDGVRASFASTARRSLSPSLAIAGYANVAQLMVASGMVRALIDVASQKLSHAQGFALAPAIGILSGLLTGSNTAANALMVGTQAELGAHWGQAGLFAAMHSSGAGHAVFASIPMLVLVMAIASENGHDLSREESSSLLRFALRLLPGIYVCVLLAALVAT
jgi:lactate permease